MTTTRRNLLKLTAPALAAVTLPAAALGADPVTDLLAQLRAAEARVIALTDEFYMLEDQLKAARLLSDPSFNDAPPEIRRLWNWCIERYTPKSIADVKQDTQGGLWSVGPDTDGAWSADMKAVYQARLADGRTKLRWWVSEIRRRRDAVQASGYYALDEKLSAAHSEVTTLREQLIASTPRTAAGIAALLTVAADQMGCSTETPADEAHAAFPHAERLVMAAYRALAARP